MNIPSRKNTKRKNWVFSHNVITPFLAILFILAGFLSSAPKQDPYTRARATHAQDTPLDDQSQTGEATNDSTDVGGLDDQSQTGEATNDSTDVEVMIGPLEEEDTVAVEGEAEGITEEPTPEELVEEPPVFEESTVAEEDSVIIPEGFAEEEILADTVPDVALEGESAELDELLEAEQIIEEELFDCVEIEMPVEEFVEGPIEGPLEDIPLDDQSQTGEATEDSTDVGGLDDQSQTSEATEDDTAETPVEEEIAEESVSEEVSEETELLPDEIPEVALDGERDEEDIPLDEEGQTDEVTEDDTEIEEVVEEEIPEVADEGEGVEEEVVEEFVEGPIEGPVEEVPVEDIPLDEETETGEALPTGQAGIEDGTDVEIEIPVEEEIIEYEEVEVLIEGKLFRCKKRISDEEPKISEEEVIEEVVEAIEDAEDKNTLVEGTLLRERDEFVEQTEVSRIKLAEIDIRGKQLGDEISVNEAIEALIALTTTEEDIEKAVIRSILKQKEVDIASVVLEDGQTKELLKENAKKGLLQSLENKVGKTIAQRQVLEDLAVDLEDDPDMEDILKLMVTEDLKRELVKRTVQKYLQGEEAKTELEDDVAELIKDDYNKFILESLLGEKLKKKQSAQDILLAAIAVDEEEVAKAPTVPVIKVVARGPGGVIPIPLENLRFESGSVILIVDPIRKFTPGLYQIEVEINNPITQQTETIIQDFAWGVLAMNTRRDIYRPGDMAVINIGVLDDNGRPVCDADVVLEVESPSGSIGHPKIENTGNCEIFDSLNTKPDYLANYTFSQDGEYILRLTATLSNGKSRIMNSKVIVTKNPDFIIERRAATRLFPQGISPMSIDIYFFEDFDGYISDVVPADFLINSIESTGNAISSEGEVILSDDGKTKLITWQVQALAGNTQSFRYFYDAPDVSPEFFTIGPLNSSGALLEKRQWQIANDEPYIGADVDNLVGHWKFNTGSGSSAVDSSGNGYTGTLVNMEAGDWSTDTPTASNENPYSLIFDGTNEYVDVSALDSYPNGSGYLSLSAWVKFSTSQSGKNIVGWWYSRNNHLKVVSDSIYFYVDADDAIGTTFANSNSTLNDGSWHHIAGTYDKDAGSNNVILYVDGVAQTVTDTTTGTIVSTDQFDIGTIADSTTGTWNFNGYIDDVRIYDKALTADEVSVLASGNAPGGVATNLNVWLKADAGVTNTGDSTDATAWTDQSGNGIVLDHNTSPAIGGTYPTYYSSRINYNPALDFDTTTDRLGVDSFSDFPTGDFFIAAAYQVPDISNNDYIFNYAPDATDSGMRIESNGELTTYYNGTLLQSSTIGNTDDGYPHIATTRRSGTTLTHVFDGKEETTSTNATSATTGGCLIIGNDTDDVCATFATNEAFTGDLAEMLIYSGYPSATEQNKINSYLALKYGITLDQTSATDYFASDCTDSTCTTGTIMWDASAAGSYNYDIAGIGQDDDSALDQTQSKSNNSDAILRVEVSDTTTQDDLDFLTWANNDGAASWTSTSAPTGYKILSRQWRAQDINDVGTVDLEFDVEDVDFNVPFLLSGSYYLIYDKDNDGSLSDECVGGGGCVTPGGIILMKDDATGGDDTASDNKWTAQVDFDGTLGAADGVLDFTIAAVPKHPGGVGEGLDVWLRADTSSVTHTGDATDATAWTDLSPNAYVFDHNTDTPMGGTYPTWNDALINNNPALTSDANTDRIGTNSFDHWPTGDMFIATVFQRTDGADLETLYNYATSANYNDSYLFIYDADDIRIKYNNNFLNSDSGVPADNGIPHITTMRRTGSTISQVFDGDEVASEANSGSSETGGCLAIIGSVATTLCGSFNTINTFEGDVAEMLIYSSYPSATEQQRINSYLALKYGITLDQTAATDYFASDCTDATCTTGTIMWDASAAGSYNYDIAGIGQDDDSALDQTDSKSQNSDGILRVADATSQGDLDFLTWSNNNGAATWTGTGAPSGYKILSRQWRSYVSSNTKDIGTIDFEFDVADSDFDVPAPEAGTLYYFVYDKDDDGVLTDETVAGGGVVAMVDDGLDTVPDGSNGGDDTASDSKWTAQADFSEQPASSTQIEFTIAILIPMPGGVLSDIALWLKANDGTSTTTDGATVNTWSDKSGNSNDGTAVNTPAYQNDAANLINYNPVVEFVSNDYYIMTDTSLAIETSTMFVVASPAANSTHRTLYRDGAGDIPLIINTGTDNVGYWDGSFVDSARDWAEAEVAMFQVIFGPSGSSANYYKNGSTAAATAMLTTSGEEYLHFGNDEGGSQAFGNVAETIVHDTNSLTATEISKIQSYLAIKYGITLDQSAGSGGVNYIASDETVIRAFDNTDTFEYDIAGIGQDDASALDQTQSKSINSDAILRVADATLQDDGDFITWSNTDGAATWTSSDVPSGYRKLSRQWRLQETGDIGTIDLEFDVADSDFNVPALNYGSNYFFIYDTNDDNALSDETIGGGGIVAMSDSGNAGDDTASDNKWTVQLSPPADAKIDINIATLYDDTDPSVSITGITESSDYIYYSGTLYYTNVPATPGSFTINVSASDTQSGIASVSGSTAFLDTPTDLFGPSYTLDYSIEQSSTCSSPITVTATNNASLDRTANLTCTLDTAAPTGGSTTYTNGYENDTTLVVDVSRGTDSGSGLSIADSDYLLGVKSATLSAGTCSSWSPLWSDAGVPEVDTATSYNYTSTHAKCYQFNYRVMDRVSNSVTYTGTDITKVDTAAPVSNNVDINSGDTYTASAATTLTLSSTDATSGLDEMQFSCNNSNYTTPVPYSTSALFNITNEANAGCDTSQGTKTVYAKFKDAAGNWTTAVSDTIVYDFSAPTSNSILINSDDEGTSSAAVTLNLYSEDATSGMSEMKFSCNDINYTTAEAYGTSKAFNLVAYAGAGCSAGQGVKPAYAKFSDNAGNWSASVSDTIVYDASAPSVNITSVTESSNYIYYDGTLYYTNVPATPGSFTVNVSASDTGSNIDNVSGSFEFLMIPTADTSGPYTLNYTIAQSTTCSSPLTVTATNIASLSSTDDLTCTLDTTGPTCSTWYVDGGLYTNDPAATLTIACTDATTSVFQMEFSCDAATWSGWESYATSASFNLNTGAGCTSSDGLKTVRFRFRDQVINQSGNYSDTITLDTTGPTGSITNVSGNPTNDDTPTLNLTIADAGVGTAGAQMRFSCDNATWTSFEAYTTPKTNFDIKPVSTTYGCGTTDGSRTVYVQYQDSLGNTGSSYDTGAFTLDTTAPTATGFAAVPDASHALDSGAGSIDVSWTAITETNLNLSNSYVKLEDDDNVLIESKTLTATEITNKTYAFDSGTDDNVAYTATLYVEDNVGLNNTYTSDVLSADRTSPSLPGLTVSSDNTYNKADTDVNDIDTNLVGYWAFEDGTGSTTVEDWSSTDNTGTITGATFDGSDTGLGDSLSFNGSSDYVTASSYSSVTDTFTMELWVNPDATRNSTSEATSGATGTSNQRYAIFPAHGDNAFGAGHSGAGISVGTNGVSVFEHASSYMPSLLVYNTTLSGWTHIAVVYTSKQPKLYINGELVRTGLTSTKIVHPSHTFGESGVAYGYYSGLADEVRIYDAALTPAQVINVMQSGLINKTLYRSATLGGVYTEMEGFEDDFLNGIAGASPTTQGWTLTDAGDSASDFNPQIQADGSVSIPLRNTTAKATDYITYTLPAALNKAKIEFDAYVPSTATSWNIRFQTNNGILLANQGNSNWRENLVTAWYTVASGVSEDAWHSIMILIDGDTQSAKYFVDGVYQDTLSGNSFITTADLSWIRFYDYGYTTGTGYVRDIRVTPIFNDDAIPDDVVISGDGGHGTSWSSDNTVNFSWGTGSDNGTTQYFKAKSTDSEGNASSQTAAGSSTVTTGILGYETICPASLGEPTDSGLLTDEDMEEADTSSWTSYGSGTLSKETGTPHGGSRVLRITRNGGTNFAAYQTILTSGKSYRVHGWARGDGNAYPAVSADTDETLWKGSTSTSWQEFDQLVIAQTGTALYLRGRSTVDTQYVEYDDVLVTELDTVDTSYECTFEDGTTNYFYVRAWDNAYHESSSWDTMGPYSIDTSAPTTSANNSSASWVASTPTITLSTADTGGSGLNYSKYSWDTSDATCRSIGTSFTNGNTTTIISEGDHTLYLCNADNVGLTGSWNGPYKLDESAPSGGSTTYTNDYETDTTIVVDVDRGTDGYSGLSTTDGDYLLEYKIADLTAGTCDGFSGWTDSGEDETAAATSYNYASTTAKCYQFQYTVKDAVGNTVIYTGSSVTKVDALDPVVSFSIANDYYSPSTFVHADTISGTASDTGGSGLAGTLLTIQESVTDYWWNGSGWQVGGLYLGATGTTTWNYEIDDVNFTSGRVYTVNAVAFDNALNTGNVEVDSFTFDSSNPTVSITGVTESSNYIYYDGTLYYTNSPATPGSFTINISASDDESGIASVSGSTEFGDTPSDATSEYTLTYSIEQSFTCTTPLTVTAENNATLTNTANMTCTLDTAGPTCSTWYVDGGLYTNDPDVTLTIACTDTILPVYQMEFSCDAATWSGWEAYSTSGSFNVNTGAGCSVGDGVKSVKFRFRDQVINQSSNYADSITLDTTAPTIDSITSVASDSSLPYLDTTDDSSTSIVFASSDATSAVSACKWDTSDVVYASMSNVCASTTNCVANLSGEGAKTVYMRCIDNAGNPMTSSETVSYEIRTKFPGGVSTSIALWLKANDGTSTTTDGATVNTWSDKSGNSNNGTAVNTPAYQDDSANLINNYPVVEFNGSDYFTMTDTSLAIETSTMFVVASPAANSTHRTLYRDGAGDIPLIINTGTDNVGYWDGSFVDSARDWAEAEVAMFQVIFGPSGSSANYYKNGSLAGATATLTTTGEEYLHFGNDEGGSQAFGNVAETIVHDTNSLTATEISKIESYLAIKYGITIDQTSATDYFASDCTDATCTTGTIMWDASAAGSYNYDIAGIGQDDDSGLDQTQSKSINSNAILRVADATSQDNLDFLMWSNNNGAATWTTTGAPTDYNILTRKWQAQEDHTSHDIGTVDLEFDVADSDFNVPALEGGSSYYFIYDSNNDGSLSDETPVAMKDDATGGDDTGSDDKWTAQLDFNGSGGTQLDDIIDFTIASKVVPAVDTISLPATDVNTDLALSFTTSPAGTKGVVDWKKDTASIALLNMPFEANNGSESTATSDYSDNSYDGTVSNATWSSTSGQDSNGAYTFDGNDDYITMGDIAEMDTPGYFTVMTWFKRTSDVNSATNHSVENVLFAQSSNAVGDNFELGTDGTNIEIYIDSADYDPLLPKGYNAGIVNGTWYHVALTYDQDASNEVKLYVDGSLANQWSDWGGALDSSTTSPLTLGIARPSVELWGDFDGIMDEVYIYDRVLSANQIAEYYNAGTFDPNTIAAEETAAGDDWQACVTPNDGVLDGAESCSNTITVTPTVDTTSLPAANTNEDLALTFTTTPSNARGVVNWKKDQTAIAVLNMPFEQVDSTTSNNAVDYSGYANDGSEMNGPTWNSTAGLGSTGAYEFDGSNDYIEISDSSELEYTGGDMTLALWVYVNASDADGGYFISKPWNGSGEYNYQMNYNSGRNIGFSLRGDSTYGMATTETVTADAWHYIVGTVDSAGNMVIYIDGDSKKTGTHTITGWTPVSGDSNLPLAVGTLYPYGGAWGAGNSLFTTNGFIDEVQIFNTVLSPEQVTALYNSGTPDFNALVAEETTDGDDWQACITPNAGGLDGTEVCSSEITIKPGVTDTWISIAGASGIGGAYIVGDTITVTWDNSATGDNNTSVLSSITADLSGWGGLAAEGMTDTTACGGTGSDNVWEACHPLVSGALDDINVNTSVSATNTGGTTTTSDTTNATVDNQPPTVTINYISVTGDNGNSGEFIIDDIPIGTWVNTGGDGNPDIFSVSFDLSDFVSGDTGRTGSGPNTWTASTSTTVDSPQEDSNNNTTVTVTDDAGNITVTADTDNYTVDATAPSGTSITPGSTRIIDNTTPTFTVGDGTDGGSGINIATRDLQRRNAPYINNTCETYGDYSTVAYGGTYPSITDISANGTACYQYTWSVSDNAGNTTTTSPTTITRAPLTTIVKTGGDSQSYGDGTNNPIGYTLPTPLQVQVTDGGTNWALTDEVTVDFAITSVPSTPTATGQSLGSASDNTDASGNASTTLTFGDRAGVYQVQATSTHVSITVEPTFSETAGQHFSLVVTEASATINLDPSGTATDSVSPTVTVTTNAASYDVALTPDQWPTTVGLDELLNWAASLGFGWNLNLGTVTAYTESFGDPAATTAYTCTGDTCQGDNVIDIDIHAGIDYTNESGAYTNSVDFSGQSISY